MTNSFICFLTLFLATLSASHSLATTLKPSTKAATTVSKTPKNLEEIFKARCKEYITIVNPEPFKKNTKDCNHLWNLFTRAFANKSECTIEPDDYEEFMVEADHLETLKNKVMFWSGDVYPFVIDFAHSKKYITIRDQLAVYILKNIETWCGKTGETGINFDKCLHYSVCPKNAVGAFWSKLSSKFAQKAEDTVHVMFNASSKVPFNENRTFGRSELPKLKKDKVKELQVFLVGKLDGSKRETCQDGSMKTLRKTVEEKGINFNCWDADPSVWHLQCLQSPQGCSSASPLNAPNLILYALILYSFF